MADENPGIGASPDDIRRSYLSVMKSTGKYVCRPGYRFLHSKMYDKHEYARRFSLEFHDEQVQIMRYLAELTFADDFLIRDAAARCRARGVLSNVIIDRDYLKKLTSAVVRYGAAVELVYDDPQRVSKGGDHLRDSRALSVYCFTDMGAGTFKKLTESTEYIGEMLSQSSDLEIMRRLCINHMMSNMAPYFEGTTVRCSTEKVYKTRRETVYGCQRNDKSYVVYEPVFFRREATIQTEEELSRHYLERAEFVARLFEEKAGERKKVLVLVLEEHECAKRAVPLMKDLINAADETYITTESLVMYMTTDSSAEGRRAGELTPLLRLEPVTAEDGRTGFRNAYRPGSVFKFGDSVADA